MTPEDDELNPPITYWIVRTPKEKHPIAYKKEAFADAFQWIANDLFEGEKVHATPEALTEEGRKKHGYKLEKWAIRRQPSGEILGYIYKSIWRTLMGRG